MGEKQANNYVLKFGDVELMTFIFENCRTELFLRIEVFDIKCVGMRAS